MGAQFVGATVMRVRGMWTINKGVVDHTGAIMSALVAPQDVPAANINPLSTGVFLDWFLWEPFMPTEQIIPQSIDIRSRRRLDEIGDTVHLLIGNRDATNSIEINLDTSWLVALP